MGLLVKLYLEDSKSLNVIVEDFDNVLQKCRKTVLDIMVPLVTKGDHVSDIDECSTDELDGSSARLEDARNDLEKVLGEKIGLEIHSSNGNSVSHFSTLKETNVSNDDENMDFTDTNQAGSVNIAPTVEENTIAESDNVVEPEPEPMCFEIDELIDSSAEPAVVSSAHGKDTEISFSAESDHESCNQDDDRNTPQEIRIVDLTEDRENLGDADPIVRTCVISHDEPDQDIPEISISDDEDSQPIMLQKRPHRKTGIVVINANIIGTEFSHLELNKEIVDVENNYQTPPVVDLTDERRNENVVIDLTIPVIAPPPAPIIRRPMTDVMNELKNFYNSNKDVIIKSQKALQAFGDHQTNSIHSNYLGNWCIDRKRSASDDQCDDSGEIKIKVKPQSRGPSGFHLNDDLSEFTSKPKEEDSADRLLEDRSLENKISTPLQKTTVDRPSRGRFSFLRRRNFRSFRNTQNFNNNYSNRINRNNRNFQSSTPSFVHQTQRKRGVWYR